MKCPLVQNFSRSLSCSSLRAASIRHVNIENLTWGRSLIGTLSVPRIAKSYKFCPNFDKLFVNNVTPVTGDVKFVIPFGSVLRVVEYAFAMSFDMAIVAFAEGRMFQDGKLVRDHMLRCNTKDKIDLYWSGSNGKVMKSSFDVLYRRTAKRRGRRSLYEFKIRRSEPVEMNQEDIQTQIFFKNIQIK
ncbi:hypothetical protein RF11_16325 [Thelohanellus kitauei]|uniref:Uncharacterized protein n=1 Tax=Thelohanellus kitauei TaxID=669202 RepID=A0A0C2N490_THEKT|nr:hypothetical protein RF11_16325 [Thelohanellus kitauei]